MSSYKEIIELIDARNVSENLVMDFRQNFFEAGEKSINGSRGLHNYKQYSDWLALVNECAKPNNNLLGVQATPYFAVRKSDGKIVGCIELRHTLNESLKIIGGHIGYSTLPEERKKGYATKMLELILSEARKLGIDKVLLTCDLDNVASQKTVMNCGGILETEEPFEYKKDLYYKYWINLNT